MADTVKLYTFRGSAPSLTARLMLEHKRLDHRCKHLFVGPHAFAMPPRGFDTMTVPANGPQLNAADFQIAPDVALLLRFDDLAPHIERRPAAQLARRLAPLSGQAT